MNIIQMNKTCVCCGEKLPAQEYHFTLDLNFGYGSAYDGEKLSIDLCPGCGDKMIESIVLPNEEKLTKYMQDGDVL